jgi:hypothetical protein
MLMKKKKDRSPLSLLITMMNTEEQQARAAAASRAVWLHHHGDVATSKFHSSGPREEGKGNGVATAPKLPACFLVQRN